MQSIGERLQEARKRRGATLEAAANDTKIREEYLQMLEENDGRDIPLDAIYVRGFIRNYAKFLRMDSAKLLADYDAQEPTHAVHNAPTPKSQKDLIGRLELGAEPQPAPVLAQDDTPTVTDSPKAQKAGGPKIMLPRPPAWLWPVLAGFVGVIVLWGITGAILGNLKNKKEATVQKSTAPALSNIRLRAAGDVTVIVKQIDPEKTLFAGTLKKGEERTISRTGQIRVQYSDGNLLEVERDGKRYKMGAAGAGRRVVD